MFDNYEGKYGNIHGHRWKVEIEVQSDSNVEFLKKYLR
jgi:6-pyruvoyltetrahydropterin/6-carboxytetrahydropterin synthase